MDIRKARALVNCKFSATFTREELARLRTLAEQQHCSVNSIVRTAVVEYLRGRKDA